MIAYVTIGTNDLARAKEFYGKLLSTLDANLLMESERMLGFGKSFDEPLVVISNPFDEEPATVGNGSMVALRAETRENVDALHRAALDGGGKDEGAPGKRGDQFYMAYARDPEGNKLAFYAPAG